MSFISAAAYRGIGYSLATYGYSRFILNSSRTGEITTMMACAVVGIHLANNIIANMVRKEWCNTCQHLSTLGTLCITNRFVPKLIKVKSLNVPYFFEIYATLSLIESAIRSSPPAKRWGIHVNIDE